MEKIVVKGGQRLTGRVKVEGAKNAVLPIQAASILASSGNIKLSNVPILSDVTTMNQLLRFLNIKVDFDKDKHVLTIDAADPVSSEAPLEYVSRMRASMVVLGPLLARTGHAQIALPGGCAIGSRPIDLHLKGLRQLGAIIEQHDGYLEARTEHLIGDHIYLDFPSVGATQNLMMAATLAQGITTIENAASEPEIVDLANMLNKMGARVHGAGTDIIRIQGVNFLHGCEHTVMPDRIEAGTFMIATAITNGDVVVEGAIAEHNTSLIAKLEEMGVTVIVQEDGIRVLGTSVLIPTNIKTLPYPGFPTDLQSMAMTLLTTANGVGIITESLYENRFMQVPDLNRMGADIHQDRNHAIIKGVKKLSGATLTASDLRAGASLVVAALMAEGNSIVEKLHHIDRGYENFENKIRLLGGKIERRNEDSQINLTEGTHNESYL